MLNLEANFAAFMPAARDSVASITLTLQQQPVVMGSSQHQHHLDTAFKTWGLGSLAASRISSSDQSCRFSPNAFCFLQAYLCLVHLLYNSTNFHDFLCIWSLLILPLSVLQNRSTSLSTLQPLLLMLPPPRQ